MGQRCILRKLSGNIKLGGVSDTPDGSAAIQKDHNSLEKWTNRNVVKFNKKKYQVYPLGRNKPRHQYRLKVNQLQSRSEKNDLGILMANMSQHILAARKASVILGCIRRDVAITSGDMILPLFSALMRHVWSAVFSSGITGTRETWTYCCESSVELWILLRYWSTLYLRELGLFSLKKRLKGILSMCINTRKGSKEDRARVF